MEDINNFLVSHKEVYKTVCNKILDFFYNTIEASKISKVSIGGKSL